jgi:hypothetical protein
MRFDDLPDWDFTVKEKSAGVYQVVGVNNSSNRVESMGTDLEVLLQDCKEGARKIDRQLKGLG